MIIVDTNRQTCRWPTGLQTVYDCEFSAHVIPLGKMLVTEDKALLAALPKVCRSLTNDLDFSTK